MSLNFRWCLWHNVGVIVHLCWYSRELDGVACAGTHRFATSGYLGIVTREHYYLMGSGSWVRRLLGLHGFVSTCMIWYANIRRKPVS